jgi:hypothetical protein
MSTTDSFDRFDPETGDEFLANLQEDFLRATLIGWKPNRAGTRLGFATISHPEIGFVFHDCPVYANDGVLNISPPDKAWTGSTGKTRYSVVISFTKAEAKRRWQAAALAAIERAMPGPLLQAEEAP